MKEEKVGAWPGGICAPYPFDAAETLDCGQAFRWAELPGETGASLWEGVAFGKVLRVEQRGQQVWLDCSPEDYEHTWRAYFDLGEDYAPKREALAAMSPLWPRPPPLPRASAFCVKSLGALCSFIISQNTTSPASRDYRAAVPAAGGGNPRHGWHAFPTAERLAACSLEDLAPLRAGFRAKYLLDAATGETLIVDGTGAAWCSPPAR